MQHHFIAAIPPNPFSSRLIPFIAEWGGDLSQGVSLAAENSPTGAAQHREVYANNGLAAQNDRRILFGLGSRPDKEARITVRWCGYGKEQTYTLKTGQYHRIEQQ